jgi:hypothetical protein
LFDALEQEADVEAPRTFVDARVFLNASEGSNLADGGTLLAQRGGWSATIGRKLGDETLAALEISTEATFYNFGGNTTLVPGSSNPFNDLYRASLAGTLQTPIDGNTSYFAGIELALGGEDEADARESLSIGAAGGVRHKANDDFEMRSASPCSRGSRTFRGSGPGSASSGASTIGSTSKRRARRSRRTRRWAITGERSRAPST